MMMDYAVRGEDRYVVVDDLTYGEQIAMSMENAVVLDMGNVRNAFIGGREARFEVLRPFDSKYGFGWLPEDAGSIPDPFPDLDGKQLAHDFVEHQNGLRNIGPLWDELEAIGARWFLRPELDAFVLLGIIREAIEYGGQRDAPKSILRGTTDRDWMFNSMPQVFGFDPFVKQWGEQLLKSGWLKAKRRFGTREKMQAVFDRIEDELKFNRPKARRAVVYWNCNRAIFEHI